MKKELYKAIASKFEAMQSCNQEGYGLHRESIENLVKDYMPSGSGIDTGTKFNFDLSTPNKLVFILKYHHMNETGYYNGWTEHKLIVTACLYDDFQMKITGPNRNDVKEYLYQTYDYALRMEVDA